jgi:hypothetical protein
MPGCILSKQNCCSWKEFQKQKMYLTNEKYIYNLEKTLLQIFKRATSDKYVNIMWTFHKEPHNFIKPFNEHLKIKFKILTAPN